MFRMGCARVRGVLHVCVRVGVFCVSVCARCATISYSSGSVEPHVRASGVQRKSAI